MQHIASRQALEASTARLLQDAANLDDAGLGALGDELRSVGSLLLREVPLRRTLSEATLSLEARVGILTRVLQGKVGERTLAVVQFTLGQTWSNGRDLQSGITRLGRTAMFLRAERTGTIDEVEDQLFRFSRIIDGSPELSVVLDDPTVDPQARGSLITRLLGDRADPLVTAMVVGLAQDPAGRSFTHGLRELVDQAAARRHKVVAVVKSAVAFTPDQTRRLVTALTRIYGREVSVHLEVEPGLVGGVRVQVGDEVIDGSIAGRLDTLRRTLAGS